MDLRTVYDLASTVSLTWLFSLPLWWYLVPRTRSPAWRAVWQGCFIVSFGGVLGGLAVLLAVEQLVPRRMERAAPPTTLHVARTVVVSRGFGGAAYRLLTPDQTLAAAEAAYVAAQRGAGMYCGMVSPAHDGATLPVVYTLTSGACVADDGGAPR